MSDSLPFSSTYATGLTGLPDPSNFGRCVDVWAPGNAIVSTWSKREYPHTQAGLAYSGNPIAGSQGWGFLSGTSMAAPHVAGAAAYRADTSGLSLVVPEKVAFADMRVVSACSSDDNRERALHGR